MAVLCQFNSYRGYRNRTFLAKYLFVDNIEKVVVLDRKKIIPIQHYTKRNPGTGYKLLIHVLYNLHIY
mgnify:CR=1 FL=1